MSAPIFNVKYTCVIYTFFLLHFFSIFFPFSLSISSLFPSVYLCVDLSEVVLDGDHDGLLHGAPDLLLRLQAGMWFKIHTDPVLTIDKLVCLWFWPNSDPELFTPNNGRYLKYYWINIQSAPYWLYNFRLISGLEHYYSLGTQYDRLVSTERGREKKKKKHFRLRSIYVPKVDCRGFFQYSGFWDQRLSIKNIEQI